MTLQQAKSLVTGIAVESGDMWAADLAFAATLRGDLSGSSSYSATLPFSLPADSCCEGCDSMLLRFLRGGCSMGALSQILLGLKYNIKKVCHTHVLQLLLRNWLSNGVTRHLPQALLG